MLAAFIGLACSLGGCRPTGEEEYLGSQGQPGVVGRNVVLVRRDKTLAFNGVPIAPEGLRGVANELTRLCWEDSNFPKVRFDILIEDPDGCTWEEVQPAFAICARFHLTLLYIDGVPMYFHERHLSIPFPRPDFLPIRITAPEGMARIRRHAKAIVDVPVIIKCSRATKARFVLDVMHLLDRSKAKVNVSPASAGEEQWVEVVWYFGGAVGGTSKGWFSRDGQYGRFMGAATRKAEGCE